MSLPKSAAALQNLTDDELPAALFEMLIEGTKRSGKVERRGRASLVEALHYGAGVNFSGELPGTLRERLVDAFQLLCERGIVWFNPHAEGSSGGYYEFTKRGRSASLEEVSSSWPSARDALERFPQHEQWDKTIAAYFRMAVATHEARLCEPALFLIGGAAERLIAVVEERVAHLLRGGWERRKLPGERLAALAQVFKSAGDAPTAELLEVLGNSARWSRNDVGHPKPKPPSVDPQMVAARITEFPGYVERVLRAAEAIA